jgi:hypothetical protein
VLELPDDAAVLELPDDAAVLELPDDAAVLESPDALSGDPVVAAIAALTSDRMKESISE